MWCRGVFLSVSCLSMLLDGRAPMKFALWRLVMDAAFRFFAFMTTALITHPASLEHHTPPGHPEQVARYASIMQALGAKRYKVLDWREAPVCDDGEILRCHPEAHLARIRAAIPATGTRALDADTHVSPGSLEAAMRAVGGACLAVDAVMAGEVANAFVAMRPPGHHCETESPMRFYILYSHLR